MGKPSEQVQRRQAGSIEAAVGEIKGDDVGLVVAGNSPPGAVMDVVDCCIEGSLNVNIVLQCSRILECNKRIRVMHS